jgi:phosphosulfolactate synthase (CoM biosynthesis protein A)
MELTTAKAKPSLAEAKLRSQELAKQIGDDLAAAKAERLAEAKIKMKELGKKMKEDDLAAAKGEHLVKAAKRPQKP